MPVSISHPIERNPLTPLWGDTWQDAAWRACAVFLLADVLPRLLTGHPVAGLQWFATLASFGLVAVAVFRLQERGADAAGADEEVVLLSDDAARPATLDTVVAAAVSPQGDKPHAWSVEVLHALEWRRMADLCLAFYKERGLSGALMGVSADGSVDVRLYQGAHRSEDADQMPFALLHCRARGQDVVGIEAIAALQRRMAEAGVSRAFFMGAWQFDEAAKAAAKHLQITLIDDRMFLTMIGRLPGDERQRLLNLAVEGDYTTPSCPACALKMIPRENAQGRYWGCRAFPRCKSTLGMRG